MITLLFDIDGTLIQTGGAGLTAISKAFERVFGTPELPEVRLHGRTDMGILTDIFDHHDVDYPKHRDQFDPVYWSLLPNTLNEVEGSTLPGVTNLLSGLNETPEFALGLLTGNAKRPAEIKLNHFGLQDYFEFGGFGDDHADRNDVAKLAKKSAATHLGPQFREDRVWVIGDTINDIRCARSIGAKVLVVETGGAKRSDLLEARPDVLMPTLEDNQQFLEHVSAN